LSVIDATLVIAIVALVAVLFVLAMVEASLLHVRRSAVAAQASDTDRQAHRLLGLLAELPTVMNSVLLAVLLTQVTATALAGVLAQRWIGGTGITIATLAVTIVLFVYGEAIPKTIAIADPVRHARRFSGLTRGLTWVLRPVVSVLLQVAKWQSPTIQSDNTFGAVSERELLHLTGEAAEAGEIDRSDAELIQKSFTLGDLLVSDIMIPTDDIISVSASTPVDAALHTAIGAGHRRLIVHDGSPDRAIGFVRLRDLAHATTISDDATAGTYVRNAPTVNRGALVIDVFREMQRTRRPLAVITNADDTLVGIVTVEDIVEELLGHIDEPEQGNDHSATTN
jgi:CBS domain containing-hemolysin-like protein